MRMPRIFWIVGALALTACSSFEPRDNPWPEQRIEPASPLPVDLPAWPDIGNDFTLTPKQAQTLLEYADAAEANTEIAQELSAAVRELSASHNALVEAGNAEHELAELRGRMLEEERRARLIDKILWGSLGIFGVAIGLQ